MALPETGAISFSMINEELKQPFNQTISLNDEPVRKLAKIPSGTISLADLRGKKNEPSTPEECDYFFTSFEDFKTRIGQICTDSGNSLAEISLGFDDSVTELVGTFSETLFPSSLKSFPKFIWGRNIRVIDYVISNSPMTSIPSTLVSKCENLVKLSNLVMYCTSIKSVPVDLLAKNTRLESIDSLFYNTQRLTGLPSGIFDNNLLLSDISRFMSGVKYGKTVPEDIFKNNTNLRKANFAFDSCKLMTVAPKLWITHPNIEEHIYCYSDASSLPFYDEIPEGWK